MSLIPIWPATFQCTFSNVATNREAKNSPVTMRSCVRGTTRPRLVGRAAVVT
jgi:hypothetical protein